MNTFHSNISILIHISMAVREAETPPNHSTTCTVCLSSKAPDSAGSHTWYCQGPICAPCGLQGARGKGLMRDLWHDYLGLPGPYRNRKQLTYSCLPVGEEEGYPHIASKVAQTSRAGHKTPHCKWPFLQRLKNYQANPPWQAALVKHS